jgi:hypothetical protein
MRDVIRAREGGPGDTMLAKQDLSIGDDTSMWWDIKGDLEDENIR